ncbi:hypothetical protein ACHAPT_009034 [Fusarium lateritium]
MVRCAIHWAREYELYGPVDWMPEETRVTLRQISTMELEDSAPLTMIHQAIRGKTTHSLDECIQMEPQHINTPDEVGYAPLHWAVAKQDMTAFQTLIKASANVNQQTSHGLETPLHMACLNHNVGMVRTLLESGASISLLDRDKWAPLHYATHRLLGQQQDLEIVQILLDGRADPNCRNSDGRTPLHILFDNHANSCHLKATARALMDVGADLEVKDMHGRTALLHECIVACRNVSILIDLGAHIKAVDGDGENMLSHLIRNEADLDPNLSHPGLLVGIDPDVRENYGNTPLDFLASRVGDLVSWHPLQIRVVVDMVDRILGTREANWEAGLFLDEKQESEADGSHARMRNWVMRQRQLMQQDESWGDFDCEEDDLEGWYQDEYDTSSASDRDDYEQHVPDDSSSGQLETVGEDDGDDDNDGHEHDGDEQHPSETIAARDLEAGQNNHDEQDWSESEDSIIFHDAHESLE